MDLMFGLKGRAMQYKRILLGLGLLLLYGACPALARIKLTALPVRERVEIQLDNDGHTLVEEERIVPLLKSTFQRGNNHIDFSWSNTKINKESILFRAIAIRENGKFRPIDGKQVCVINVSFPPNENALVWEVFSAKACAVKVRVSYLIGDLTRYFSYRALADREETYLSLRCFLKLRNYSGEAFGRAGVWAGFGPRFKKVVGQQEEIQMLLHRFEKVAIEKTFTFDWYRHGALNPAKPLCSRVLMHYRLTNDEKNGLGRFPLKPGKVRIFIRDGHGGQAFLGEDAADLTPLDGTMKLYLGESRDIVCRRSIERNIRHRLQGNLFNQEIIIKYQIENFKDKACTLDILEQLNRVAAQYGPNPHGDVEWEMGKETSSRIRFDFKLGKAQPKLSVKLAPRPKKKNEKVEKLVVTFHFTLKNLW
jgi:hypothetical protein